MKLKLEKWVEARSGLSGGTKGKGEGARAGSANLTSIDLFRGYRVSGGKVAKHFDREHYASYAECRKAAEDYMGRVAA